jgi:hypothetical protein
VWVDAGSYDHTALARIPPFDAIELEVGRLFPPRYGRRQPVTRSAVRVRSTQHTAGRSRERGVRGRVALETGAKRARYGRFANPRDGNKSRRA